MASDVKCPVCGSRTRLGTRRSDGSKFYVCINWPDCRGKVACGDEWDFGGDDWGDEKPVFRATQHRSPQRREKSKATLKTRPIEKRWTNLRKAAGVLMAIGAIIGFVITRAICSDPPDWLASYVGLLKWLSIALLLFVFTGGMLTARRKEWLTCLIAAYLLTPIVILPILAWTSVITTNTDTDIPFAIGWTLFLLVTAILPVVVIHRRKKDWLS